MALRRFYIDKENITAEGVRLRGDMFHHIRDVCRFGVGDQFEVLTGDGFAQLVEISSLSNKELLANVLSQRAIMALSKPLITLCLSIPKLPKVDWIVEKSVELGVYEIRPFVSDFSFLRKVSEISPNRVQRWEKLAQGATQQSGRGELMRIGEATTLKNLLSEFNRLDATGGLFPYEGEARTGLKGALAEIKNSKLDHLWVFVGSEGGFSAGEVQMFADSGLNSVSLGDQILRVETACVALVSVIKYELGAG